MDWWFIVIILNYLLYDNEVDIVLLKVKYFQIDEGWIIVLKMVCFVDMMWNVFVNGDLFMVMSLWMVIIWVENVEIFGDVGFVFWLIFFNKCDDMEQFLVVEFYQCCFGEDLLEFVVNVVMG